MVRVLSIRAQGARASLQRVARSDDWVLHRGMQYISATTGLGVGIWGYPGDYESLLVSLRTQHAPVVDKQSRSCRMRASDDVQRLLVESVARLRLRVDH